MSDAPCAAGSRCNFHTLIVQGSRHRCPGKEQNMDCDKPLHTICGIPIPEAIVKNAMHSNWCFECGASDVSTFYKQEVLMDIVEEH